MDSEFKTLKSTGDLEEFSSAKLIKSIVKAGAPLELAEEIESEIESNPEIADNTTKIREYVTQKLADNFVPIAARYNIRDAIGQLGPSGYPFEKFIAGVFEAQGYHTETNQTLPGACISHEIDVVVYGGDEGEDSEIDKSISENQSKQQTKEMVEVKFHNRTQLKSAVKVALYVHSRFNDLKENGNNFRDGKGFTGAIIATNTKFSKDAMHYAECHGIKLLSWNYPKGRSLPNLIDQLGIHPVTALSSISNEQKRQLIDADLVLCRQLSSNRDRLIELGVSEKIVDQAIAEADAIYRLKPQI